MPLEQSAVRNRLLALLEPKDFAQIASYLEPIELPQGFQISRHDQPIEYGYFMDSGIGSAVAVSPENHKAEAGIIGREGLLPVALVLGCGSAPYDCVVQVAGYGHRITQSALAEILASNQTIRTLFLRFAHTLLVQGSYTALSNATHHVEERLARWLLMCHDRAEGSTIALTHEFLSIMLAVRRPSVTTALHVLEGNHFINSDRGLITIRNRGAMEVFASDAYGIPEREYHKTIGDMR